MIGNDDRLAALSRWVDEAPANIGRDREALAWHRVMKIAEECGEVTEAMIGCFGGNPRKGQTNDGEAVIKELLDVATTALTAVEHLTGNEGNSINLLGIHLVGLIKRAGIEVAA